MLNVSVGKILTKIFGSRNERLLKRYRTIVARVSDLETKIQAMTDDQLRARTAELRKGLTTKKLRSDNVREEAFAIIRESMDRSATRRCLNDRCHGDNGAAARSRRCGGSRGNRGAPTATLPRHPDFARRECDIHRSGAFADGHESILGIQASGTVDDRRGDLLWHIRLDHRPCHAQSYR